MNTTPRVTRILCYGDSNTWGRSGSSTDRYPEAVRWTGLLQNMLGKSYEVIEEGLCSRTTNLDEDDPSVIGRNGRDTLFSSLESQYPTDIVILWLGTNDLKAKFDRSPSIVASSLSDLVQIVFDLGKNQANKRPKVLLVSPPLVRDEALKPDTKFKGAGYKSKQLAPKIKKIALKKGCDFVDLAQYVRAGDADGVHLEPEAHKIVAEVMLQKICDMMNSIEIEE
ncbi:acylhydrolase [Candidatus Woesebacteria bacterium]|nr:acylhydrolase [Candidatus Woesebacteria bacterium]